MPLDPILARILKRSHEAYEANDYVAARQLLKKVFYKINHHEPEYGKLVTMKATIEYKLGNREAAIELIESVPNKSYDAIYWASRAEIYRGSKRLAYAEKAISNALHFDNNSVDVQLAAAAIYHDGKHFRDAIRAGQRATKLAPTRYEAWGNLGNSYYALGEVDAAKMAYDRSLALNPAFTNGYAGRAQMEFREGEFEAAIRDYMEVLKREKRNPQAHYGLGLIALTHGEYKRGFELNEWRWRATEDERDMPLPMLPRDSWPISRGNRLMVLCEQGYGDNFLMMRYFSMLLTAGWEVTVNCAPSLHRLITENWNIAVIDGSQGFKVADYDCCIHAMSLPLLFETTIDSVPWFGAYIHGKQTYTHVYPSNYAMVWHGNPEQGDDRRRSIPELKFKAAFETEGSFSLQVPDDYAPKDWLETADYLQRFPLLITVDTGIAHLAGAMGMPVWVLLSEPCYWPYMMEGYTTPWYPSMRLFRQKKKGDWDSVIAEVKEALNASQT